MAKEKAPAYQWYPKDAESDEDYRLMTCEELGVYERLRDHQWLEGSLPCELEKLAILIGHGMTIRRLQFIWPKIAPCFPSDGEGRLANKRLERQRDELATYIAKKKLAGREGGLAKAKQTASDATGVLVANPSSASATASATAFPEERKNGTHASGGVLSGMLTRDHLRHTVCGRVCLQATQFQQFVRKLGGPVEAAEIAIRSWAKGILATWDLPPLMNHTIQGTTFQWWDARWEEWQGRPQAAKKAALLPDVPIWECPHEVACTHPRKCQQLQDIAAEKARTA